MFADTNNNGSPEIVEESHYYAFGMRIEGLSTTNPDNKFTYNGKELEDDHGLNWYHYGARFYDAQIGRWHVTDLVDELISPYTFAANNPIVVKDENGMWNEYVVRAAMLIINDGTKKYGNIYPSSRIWTDRMSETIEVFRYDLTIQERIGAKQMLCNNFIYTAFRAAGYNISEDRRPMKEWFRKNGTLFEDKEIPWEKLEPGDVLNTGSYAGMEGHVAMIVSSIVENSNGEKGYMVAHSTRRGSVDGPEVEFLSLEFIQTWLDQVKDSGDFDRWIGRMDTGPWYKPEELLTDE
jgi:RHS repeat-associated protein